ncbi:amidohydrolase family protein [Mycobacterium cookii]|uniref:Amidohydrolase n=1 Tax=Mycobacterium cookii TaxID=1775 RepID=A0A7I7L2F5_9MYCO|nr:amidohydrolase family protein [Mycobacterium cookii]MCV7329601.1 amidohydrolase family protein [Mycobacterium cookii]BBX48560.1 amidohydrolase [Mycobacterium cookii]
MSYDLLIRGGTVVDGTGAPARTADVAVNDGLIVEVGRVDGRARRTIDADGLTVTPGFVDIHTHFDGQATWDPHLTPSSWHGVTTAIMGNCGIGFAPVHHDRHDFLIELMEGVEDIPGSALAEGINWQWESFGEYLDALERMPRAVDVGTQIPQAALRAYVMGDRALDAPTADDLAAMSRAVTDSLHAGALGMSFGRTAGHRSASGQPVPGTYSEEDELAALMAAMAKAGTGVLQVVPAGVGGEMGGDQRHSIDAEVEWICRLGQQFGIPLTFLAMVNEQDPHDWQRWFADVRTANAAGANVRPQVASRAFGMLMGHQSRMNPFRHRPSYRALMDLPLEKRVVLLRDPELRARILAEPPDAGDGLSADRLNRHTFKRVYPLGDLLDYEPSADNSIAAIAERECRDPWEVTYDTLLGAEGREFLLFPLLNYAGNDYHHLHDMMSDPVSLQGLGDAGAHCGIVCDASMTTYLMSYWVRDRTRGPRIPLETAVHRLTGDPAAFYGLGDRGVLAPGRRADINLIDLENLGLHYPELVEDLPAGAGRLIQRSDGYVETLVRGQTIVDHGELTDNRPGGLVRGARPAAAA